MIPDLPANPLSIELTIAHRRFWWQIDDEDAHPEQWHVSADVSHLDLCPDELRHVGDIALVIADMTAERNLLDLVVLGDWALEFLSETVIDPDGAKLHPELDSWISPGPTRMVIPRWVELTDSWRGHGLGATLLAAALRILAPTARMAACRVSPLDFPGAPDNLSREVAALRAANALEGIGFKPWRGVHVIDMRNPALLDARLSILDQWWPEPDNDDPGETA